MIYVAFECEGRIKTKLEPATRRNSLLFAKRGGGGGGGGGGGQEMAGRCRAYPV